MIEKVQELLLQLNEELEMNRLEAEEIRKELLLHDEELKIVSPILEKSDANKLDRIRIERDLDVAHESFKEMNKKD